MNPETYEHMKMFLVAAGSGMVAGTLIAELILIVKEAISWIKERREKRRARKENEEQA